MASGSFLYFQLLYATQYSIFITIFKYQLGSEISIIYIAHRSIHKQKKEVADKGIKGSSSCHCIIT